MRTQLGLQVSGSSKNYAPVAVTIGEPAGIGPDVILMAWQQRSWPQTGAPLSPFYVIGDKDVLQIRARLLDLPVPVITTTAEKAMAHFNDGLPVVPLRAELKGMPGIPSSEDAAGIIEAIETAVRHVKSGIARAVVTAPINKKSLYQAGFSHPGHTEFLAELAGSRGDGKNGTIRPVMMLAGPRLRTVPVTIHIPLSAVAPSLTTDDIIEVATITARDLRQRFEIAHPRLAILGLNPHAGEEGAMGEEDATIIAPAVAALQRAGVDAFGPMPADTMFHERARATYDVAICMYHDQALIPAKALDFDRTVNITLGLPFVRTSPDHGTAFDIAATGKADPTSMICALQMADQLSSAS